MMRTLLSALFCFLALGALASCQLAKKSDDTSGAPSLGERVEQGEPLVTLRVADRGAEQAIELVRGAYSISD